MKKTAKSLLAVVLALVMALGTIPAFASDYQEIQWTWNEIGDGEKLYHYGTLELGKNTVEMGATLGCAYDFNVEKEGYYAVSGAQTKACEKLAAGMPYGFADSIKENYYWYENDTTTIFYFTEEKTYFQFDHYAIDNTVTIEYLGEEMTDISYDDSAFQELIIGCDVVPEYEEFTVETALTASFSGGKTVWFPKCYLECSYQETLKEGENNIFIRLPGEDVFDSITACYPEKYVKNMEITNPEKAATITAKYNGELYYDNYIGEIITVNFTDGTSKIIVYDGSGDYTVAFPNDREYRLFCRFGYDENYTSDEVLLLGFENTGYDNGSYTVMGYGCNVVKKSISENFYDMFQDNSQDLTSSLATIMDVLLSFDFSDDNAFEKLTRLFAAITEFYFSHFRYRINNFGLFIKSCF